MPFTPPKGPAKPKRSFTSRIDKAFKGAVKMAKAYNALWNKINAIEADGDISNHFIHPGKLDRPEFIVLVNNGMSAKLLEDIKDLASPASYKVETTINEALVILSNLQKLPDNVKIFTSIQKPKRKDIK
jgi:hypothetical protein